MTVLSAALKSTVLEAAQSYLAAGVSIVPLRGKKPSIASWSAWQVRRATTGLVKQWFRNGGLSGVGVICGRVSGNLVVLDFDSAEAVEEFGATFPYLLDTFTVLSGSRRGAHFYYYVHELPETIVAPNYELRSTGAYVVAPPSPHPSGNLYMVERATEPMHIGGMAAVVKWIKSKRPQKLYNANDLVNLVAPTQAKPTGKFVPREEYFRRRYVTTALRAQINFVTCASEGYRNTRLYTSALCLGQLVGSGDLARAFVESELLNAALQCGLGHSEAIATIKSGLDAGVLNPRVIPAAPKPRLN